MESYLKIGDMSADGRIEIIDEDRLCYQVRNISKGAIGIRTISKKLLNEFVSFFTTNKDATADEIRNALSGQSDIDKYEYGYASTLTAMAKMVLNKRLYEEELEILEQKTEALFQVCPFKSFLLLFSSNGFYYVFIFEYKKENTPPKLIKFYKDSIHSQCQPDIGLILEDEESEQMQDSPQNEFYFTSIMNK